MAILQTATTSFKLELFQALHNFGPSSPNTFKVALYTAAADLGFATTVYSTSNEVVGTGYTAGGNILVISTSPTTGNNNANIPTAFVSFANSSFPNSTFTARAALIYNASQGNRSVAVLDFGSDKTVNNDTFQIIFPTADANSAIVRIS
jgi:hypothetical protein